MLEVIMSALSDWMLIFALHLSGNSFPPILSAKEEKRCFELAAAGDKAARDKLINHNLRLVAHIAKKYYSSGTDSDDLISIGTIGLIKAVNCFDSAKNVRFSTFASRCIENEVLMFFRSTKKDGGNMYMDDPLETDVEGNSITVMDTLGDKRDLYSEVESRETAASLRRTVALLPARDRKIIELRYGLGGRPPLTQNEVAAMLHISRSYVSRLESKALCALREGLESTEAPKNR